MRQEARQAACTPTAPPSRPAVTTLPTTVFGDATGSIGRVLGPSTPTIGRRYRQQEDLNRQKSVESRYAPGSGLYGDRAMCYVEGRQPRSSHGCCCCCCCCGECDGGWGNLCWKCVARSSKVLLIVPNIMFVLVGIVLVALGLWMHFDQRFLQPNDLLRQVPGGPLLASFDERYALWVVVAIGCAVLLLSFIGCCGACAESAGFLCFYSTLLLILIGIEVVACLVFGVTQRQIQSTLEKTTRDRLRNLYQGTGEYRYAQSENDTEPFNDIFSASWDKTQVQLSCCGSSGPEDFRFSAWRNASRRHGTDPPVAVPPSCCIVDSRLPADDSPVVTSSTTEPTTWSLADCQREAFERWQHLDDSSITRLRENVVRGPGTSKLRAQGCAQAMLGLVNRNSHILLSVICSIILFQVINMSLACLLTRWIRKKHVADRTDPWDDETDFY